MLSTLTLRIRHHTRRLSWSRQFSVAAGGGLAAALVLLTMIVAGVGTRAGAAPYAGAPGGQELVGTWVQEVILPDRRIVNYTTFFSDGTLVGTNTDHLTRSPFHGVWVRTGDRQFAVTQFRLVFDTLGGPNAQQMKIRGEIAVDESGDQAAGRYFVEFFDPDENVVSSTPTAGQFRRMKVEAMP